jgi:hypothetical protein
VAILHFQVKSLSRAKGHNAVQRSAYITRGRLRDEGTRKLHNYQKRGGLEHTEIILPTAARVTGMTWAQDRTTLWNTAEAVESRKNARVGREYVVALPHELGTKQRLLLAQTFASALADRYGVVAELAIHRAPALGDRRNLHAHILSTTRTATATGLGAKSAMEWNDSARRSVGLPSSREEIRLLRYEWAAQVNHALKVAELNVRVDARSLWEQGSTRLPTPALTPAIIALERTGKTSYVAEHLRAQHAEQQQIMDAYVAQRSLAAQIVTTPALSTQAQSRWLAYRSTSRVPTTTRSKTAEADYTLDMDL